MTALEKAIESGQNYLNLLEELLSSNELTKEKEDAVGEILSQVSVDLEILYRYLQPKKKKYLLTGEFICNGRFDFEEGKYFEMQLLGNKINVIADRLYIFNVVKNQISSFAKSDPFFLNVNIDPIKDILNISFAVETDQVFNPVLDWSINGEIRSQTLGYTYVNKAYFRNPDLKELPDQLWQHELKGFAVPYSITGDIPSLVSKIRMACGQQGELADMRAFSQTYRSIIDPFVEQLKIKQWQRIFTAWGKWQRNPDGSYRKY